MAHLPIPTEVAADLVRASQKLYERGFVANHDGNISFRLTDGFFAATPTSFSKGDVTESDLLVVDAKGQIIAGKHKVFSEISWHLAIYRARPDVTCVVHAHPVTASAYALAGRELGTPAIPEAIVSLGRQILSSGFFSPTDTNAFIQGGPFECAVKELLTESDGFLVPGNGAWAVGQSIMQTYYRLELIEHVAKQHHFAEQLGELRRLPSDLVNQLLSRRPKTSSVTSGSSPIKAPEILPALNHVLPQATSEAAQTRGATTQNSSIAQGLTPADLKEIVRAELEQFLR